MREKLKALDRNIVALVVIAILVVGGLVLFGSNDDTTKNETAKAQQNSEQKEEKKTESDSEENAEKVIENKEHDDTNEDGHDDDDEAKETEESETATTDNDGPYSYVAQAGDSYTKMARKAVQTYGIVNKVTLTEAQIIYAETVLTQAAQAKTLEVGESVKISEETLRSTVDRAMNLDETAEANWATYVQFVDFNTDKVGESQS